MLVVVPVSKNDTSLAADLFRWVDRLGRCDTECLLVADAAVDWAECMGLVSLAKSAFRSVELRTNDKPVEGWIPGAHSLFRVAGQFAKERNTPWLWLEPDAIPLVPGWFDALRRGYEPHAGKFMGYVYDTGLTALPKKAMSGVAVYPPDAVTRLQAFIKGEIHAWDALAGDVMVKEGVHTGLIQHLWGKKGQPPRFGTIRRPGTPFLTVENIKPEAVIFHRNKDGSLIRSLWAKYYFNQGANKPTGAGFITVFPFFNGDGEMAVKNAEWIAEISKNNHFDALLSYEEGTHFSLVGRMRDALGRSFGSVAEYVYPRCPVAHWPESPNWAFQHTAVFIHQQIKRPWMWLEYDAIPVKSEWLLRLQSTYSSCRKPFMGPVVPVLNHMNGVGVYPPDFPVRCPKAMKLTGIAWDFGMKPEMERDLFNARHLIQHVWGVKGGMIHAYGGDPITFTSYADVKRYVYQKTLVFHRNKDGTLIDRMREVIHEDPHLLQINPSDGNRWSTNLVRVMV